MNANSETNREIITGFKSKIALEILDSVIGQLSDGMWENSPRMEKYWKFVECVRKNDNTVVLKIDSRATIYYFHDFLANGFYQMTDVEILNWFANKIKQIVKEECKDNNLNFKETWKRDNTELELDYFGYNIPITIADTYYVYEVLKGRKCDNKYSDEIRNRVIGDVADADTIKYRQEIRDKIQNVGSSIIKEINHQKELYKLEIEKYEKIMSDIRSKYDLAIKELQDDYAKQMTELNEKLKKS